MSEYTLTTSADIEETPLNATINESLQSPGAWLKHIREQKGLQLNDIATKLRLNSSILIKIEDDDFATIGSFSYVRGYLRSYAHVLGLPPTDIISAFNRLNLSEPDSNRARIQLHKKKPIRHHTTSSRWLFGLITIIGFAVFVGWWQWHRDNVLQQGHNTTATTSSTLNTTSNVAANITTEVKAQNALLPAMPTQSAQSSISSLGNNLTSKQNAAKASADTTLTATEMTPLPMAKIDSTQISAAETPLSNPHKTVKSTATSDTVASHQKSNSASNTHIALTDPFAQH